MLRKLLELTCHQVLTLILIIYYFHNSDILFHILVAVTVYFYFHNNLIFLILHHASDLMKYYSFLFSTGKEFRLLLRTYLDSLVQSGALCLFVPLLPSLREGEKHLYFPWFGETLSALAASASMQRNNRNNETYEKSTSVDTTIPSVSVLQIVCTYCLEIAFDDSEDLSVKQTLFDSLCVPVLYSCNPHDMITFFISSWNNLKITSFACGVSTGVIKALYDITQKDLKLAVGTGSLENLIFLQSCCYKLIEVLYDRCTLQQIKNEISVEFAGPGSKGNELTSAVSKSAYKLLRNPIPELKNIPISEILSQRLYSYALNCLAIVVAKTQNEEKFYDMFLFKQKPGEQVWSRIVDCCTKYKFFSETEKFATVFIGAGNIIDGRKRTVDQMRTNRDNRLSQYFTGSSLDGYARGSLSQNQTQNSNQSQSQSQSQFISGVTEKRNTMSDIENRNYNNKNIYNKNNRRRGILSQSQSNEIDFENLGLGSLSKKSTDLLTPKGVKFLTGNNSGNTQKLENKNDNNKNEQVNGNKNKNENEIGITNETTNIVHGLDDSIIAFEMNDINKQPCMSSLLRVIKRMNYLFGNNEYKNSESGNGEIGNGEIPIITTGVKWNSAVLPNWISEIKDRLLDYNNGDKNRNIRLFMIRLLLNQPVASIVAPYILSILPAVLECCNKDLCSATVGVGYHYLLRDVVFTLCDSWQEEISTKLPQRDREYKNSLYIQLSQLLTFLLQHTYNENNSVLIENIRSIGALIRLFTTSDENHFSSFISLIPVLSLLTVVAGPTGGAFAASKSKGTEGVKKRLAGLIILQVMCSLFIFIS